MKKLLYLPVLALLTVARLPGQPPALEIHPLTPEVYVFITYQHIGVMGNLRFPANGLYVVTPEGVVLLDTPWDTTQLQPLLDSIERRHRLPVVMSISTHYHEDRTAGIDYYRERDIATWSSEATAARCSEVGFPRAAHLFASDTTFVVGGRSFQTYYPGPGHTTDNIVVWLPEWRVLYGGCFIKSTESTDLGNIANADLAAWPGSARRTLRRFRRPEYVIPGHSGWQDADGLKHTLRLLRRHKR